MNDSIEYESNSNIPQRASLNNDNPYEEVTPIQQFVPLEPRRRFTKGHSTRVHVSDKKLKNDIDLNEACSERVVEWQAKKPKKRFDIQNIKNNQWIFDNFQCTDSNSIPINETTNTHHELISVRQKITEEETKAQQNEDAINNTQQKLESLVVDNQMINIDGSLQNWVLKDLLEFKKNKQANIEFKQKQKLQEQELKLKIDRSKHSNYKKQTKIHRKSSFLDYIPFAKSFMSYFYKQHIINSGTEVTAPDALLIHKKDGSMLQIIESSLHSEEDDRTNKSAFKISDTSHDQFKLDEKSFAETSSKSQIFGIEKNSRNNSKLFKSSTTTDQNNKTKIFQNEIVKIQSFNPQCLISHPADTRSDTRRLRKGTSKQLIQSHYSKDLWSMKADLIDVNLGDDFNHISQKEIKSPLNEESYDQVEFLNQKAKLVLIDDTSQIEQRDQVIFNMTFKNEEMSTQQLKETIRYEDGTFYTILGTNYQEKNNQTFMKNIGRMPKSRQFKESIQTNQLDNSADVYSYMFDNFQ